jgi:hypothetical protein
VGLIGEHDVAMPDVPKDDADVGWLHVGTAQDHVEIGSIFVCKRLGYRCLAMPRRPGKEQRLTRITVGLCPDGETSEMFDDSVLTNEVMKRIWRTRHLEDRSLALSSAGLVCDTFACFVWLSMAGSNHVPIT